jgi:membrane associated rhomboid family serine protease
VINLVITFALPIIDWRAHVGGLLTGAAIAAAYAYAPKGGRRTAVQVGGVVAVVALLLLGIALRTAQLTG